MYPLWHKLAYSVNSMRDIAREQLPRSVFDFADGGADDEKTLRQNVSAFDKYVLLPRPLNGAPKRDLSVNLFGKKLKLPVIIGPTGLSGLFWPNGEHETAKAAHASGTTFCLSHGSIYTMEELATTDATPRWMQVFIYKDRSFTEEFCHRADAAGFDALVLTIDNQNPVNANATYAMDFQFHHALGSPDMPRLSSNINGFSACAIHLEV